MAKKIIGIDLGSTLSEVAVIEGGKPTIIINEEGSRTTPSVICLKGGERKVGSVAKRQATVNPKETVVLIKRFMGGTYDEIKDNISHVQYEVKNVGGYPRVVVEGKEYTPEELSAMILTKMKTVAENYLGETVKDAIITVPAYFNDAQRQATKKAGEIAGLNVLRIIAEPTAAILASNIDKEKGGKYMVVDYGGSTLDFSVADISDNVVEILASNGDVYCGGSDLDKLVADWIVDEYKKSSGIDLSADTLAMSRIYEAAEKAKIELSQTTTTEINLPYITVENNVPMHLNLALSKSKFEQIIDGEIKKVVSYGKEAVKKAGLKNEDLDGILLVGGSTRIPMLQNELTKEFGRPLIKNGNPDEMVALGAAVQGGIMAGDVNDVLLLDVTPLSLGIETMGGVMTTLVEANTTIPTKKSQVFSTAADNQPAVSIVVCQGNRPMAKDNKQIGVFTLDGILPAPRGIPQIEVSFDIDANGILSVSATDKGTGKEQHITIEGSSSLTEEDIEKMKKDAEEHAEADKKEKERIDKINAGDTMVFQTEKMLKEVDDKLTEDDKKSVNEPLEELREAVKNQDVDKIEEKSKEVESAWHNIATKLYEQNGGNTDGTTQNPFNGNGNPFNPFGGNPFNK